MYHDATRIDLGPDSLLWRYAGDQRISFVGPTIGILQLMHPAIGAGVLEHSNFFGDPWGRIFRSLPRILGAVYDEDAASTGRLVRDFHRDIKGVDEVGRHYHALDPETFWWAHATFQFMAEQVADRFSTRRLRPDEHEQLYREGVEWYRRYGVSDRPVPPNRAAFQEEWDRVCAEVLEMNAAVEWVLGQLSRPRPPRLPMPLGLASPALRIGPLRRLAVEPLRVSAIGCMPAIVRERFALPWSWRDQLELEAMERAARNGWRFVPDVLRWHPTARGLAAGPAPRRGLMSRTRPHVGLEPILVGVMTGVTAVDTAGSSALDATEALLRAYGLRGWSVEDVATRAGLGRMTVYRRFASRDDLVHAVLTRELRATLATIDDAARGQKSLEDKVIEGGLVALAALRGSLVEQLLHEDPATFLPFVTTQAGPLLAIARQVLVAGARAAGVGVAADLLEEMAEAAARLSLSFILTRETVLPVHDPDALRASLRRIVAPMLASLTA